MPKIRLFTTWYSEKRAERKAEYERSLELNLQCRELHSIHVADESGCLRTTVRLDVRRVPRRPTFADFFDWINSVVLPEDLSIIANTDMSFDRSVALLNEIDWGNQRVLAVSRWDCDTRGQCRLYDRGDSQDCWVFKGPLRPVRADFPLGVYDCDNKIAWELQQAGYAVLNPALSFRCYHHHQCGYRSYEEKPARDYGIRPPFLYVEPENLWDPLTAWRLFRKHELPYLPWSMTKRRFWRYPLPALVQRVWKKARKTVGCKNSAA